MATMEDIMLTITANDQASSTFESISSAAKSSLNNITRGMNNISSSMDNMLSSVTGKSAAESIFGTSSKNETNKVLLSNMTESQEAADALFKHVDDVTNTSLTSMQDLIPAMNAFKAATGATDDEISYASDGMANFGAAVLAQTGSTDMAAGAMMDLSKGIKGAFASLDQYGVSQDALMRTGLWSGQEDDIKGYIDAVTEVIGSTDALMETNEGLDAKIGKAFSSAGKKVGNEFLPGIKSLKQSFLDLNSSMDGNLAAGILVTVQSIDMLGQGANTVSQLVNGASDLKKAWDAAGTGVGLIADKFRNLTSAAEDANNAINNLDTGIKVVGETTDITDDLFKVQEVTPEIEAAAAHAGGFGYSAESTIEELEKYAGTQKDIETDALKLLDDAKASNEAVNTAKLDYIASCEDMMNDVKIASQSVDVADDVGDIAKSTEAVAGAGLEFSAAGSEAAAAGAGAGEAAAGFGALGAGITSMLVPLLTISAVIAIMLPVVTAIAIEAIACLKLVQMAIDAMDFGSVDLNSAIEGIQQLATALGWIGVAMAAMTFANVMTGLAVMTSGFLGMTGPLDIAVNALKEANNKLSELGDSRIDPSIPNNIKNISDSLMAISTAMGALTWTNIVTGFSNWIAGALGFGSVTDGLEQAKNDIIQASNKLQEFSSLTPLDKSVADNIKNVCDSLASVGDAMDALRSMRDGQNWDTFVGGIFKGADIQTTLNDVKDDITKASTALAGFTGLSEIPKDVSGKIKKVADTLKSVSESIETLRKLRDDSNWDSGMGKIFQGSNIAETLESIRKDMFTVSAKLRTLHDISNIPEGTNKKINIVVKTLQSVMKAIEELNKIKGTDITTDSNKITKSIEDARKVLYQTSAQLRSLHDISAIQEGTGEKIKRVGNTAKKVMDAIKELNNIKGQSIQSTDLIQSIRDARKVIFDTSAELRTLNDISNINDGANEKIGKVSSTANKVMEAVQSLNKVPKSVPQDGTISQAVTSVKTAATELNKLSGTTLDGGVEGILGTISSALDSLKTTLQSSSEGFYSSGASIGTSIKNGLNSTLVLTPTVTTAVTTATSAAASSGWTGGAYIGQSTTGGFQSALQLEQAMSTEMEHVKSAVDSGISAAKTAAENGAKDVVAAFKSGVNVGSPGDIANTMRDEMAYTYDFLKRGGLQLASTSYNVARDMVHSFGNPNFNVNDIFNGLNNLLSPMGAINTLSNIGSFINPAQGLHQSKQIIFNFSNGCVQVDARNKTAREAQGLLTLALESMDHVTDVQVDGV